MRRPLMTVGAALLCAGVLFGASAGSGGCSYDWAFTSDGGATSDDANGKGGPPKKDGSIEDAPADSEPSETFVPPTPCKSNFECAAKDYCRFPDFKCGKGGPGTCESASETGCPASDSVCACSAKTYSSVCEAAHLRDDVSLSGACTPPTLTFPCGYRYCTTKQFCATLTKPSVDYACVDFSGCAAGNCTCASVNTFMMSNSCPSCDDTTKPGETRVKCQ